MIMSMPSIVALRVRLLVKDCENPTTIAVRGRTVQFAYERRTYRISFLGMLACLHGVSL
jgi:hypothetical protein